MTSTALACTVKNYLRVVENLTADLRIDIKHDNGTDNCFKFNVFVRDDKEKTKKLTEFTNELPGELSNDKYVIRDSITFEEVKDKIKTVIEVLEANKSYLF